MFNVDDVDVDVDRCDVALTSCISSSFRPTSKANAYLSTMTVASKIAGGMRSYLFGRHVTQIASLSAHGCSVWDRKQRAKP